LSSDAIQRGRLFIVSAPSGGGKTSLTRALIPWLTQQHVPAVISVSYTTRAPRPGETDGVDYHFVDSAAFEGMVAAGEFMEHAHVFDRRYGTGLAKTEALLADGIDVILDIDWQGARQVKQSHPSAVGIFLLPPSRPELERRLRSRAQDSDEVVQARMQAARDEMSHYREYDYVIVNEQFEHALFQLGSIFLERRLQAAPQARRHQQLIAQLLE